MLLMIIEWTWSIEKVIIKTTAKHLKTGKELSPDWNHRKLGCTFKKLALKKLSLGKCLVESNSSCERIEDVSSLIACKCAQKPNEVKKKNQDFQL